MSPIMLVPVAAAWAAVVKDLEGDVQVKVGVLERVLRGAVQRFLGLR